MITEQCAVVGDDLGLANGAVEGAVEVDFNRCVNGMAGFGGLANASRYGDIDLVRRSAVAMSEAGAVVEHVGRTNAVADDLGCNLAGWGAEVDEV